MAVGKIFWRTGAGAYYCKVDGKQVRLSTQLDHAEQKHRLLMIEHGATSNPTVADICHLYLDHVGKRNAAKTLERRQHTLNSLIAQYGTLDAKTLSAKHLSAWVEKERGGEPRPRRTPLHWSPWSGRGHLGTHTLSPRSRSSISRRATNGSSSSHVTGGRRSSRLPGLQARSSSSCSRREPGRRKQGS